MRDATYVVFALALCMLVLLVFSMNKPAPLSMMDLAEFKTLPIELRTTLRRMLPDPAVIRQRWASMTPGQKQMVVQQIGGMIPQPRPHHHPVPETVPEPDPPAPAPAPAPIEITVEPELEGFKKGFLLGDAKKKNTKDKKKNKVVTLGSVAPDDDASGNSFLGSDQ